MGPYATANERMLLGSLLLLGSTAESVQAPRVDSDDFGDLRCAAIYVAMLRIMDRGDRLSYAAIEAQLEIWGQLRMVGGLSGISDLIDTGCSRMVDYYAQNVRDAAGRRRVAAAARDVVQAAENWEPLAGPVGALVLAAHALEQER